MNDNVYPGVRWLVEELIAAMKRANCEPGIPYLVTDLVSGFPLDELRDTLYALMYFLQRLKPGNHLSCDIWNSLRETRGRTRLLSPVTGDRRPDPRNLAPRDDEHDDWIPIDIDGKTCKL